MWNRQERRRNNYIGRARKNVLHRLGEGETPTVKALILYFDGGLFRPDAIDGFVRESKRDISLNSGIPYSSLKRGMARLEEKGILIWDTRKGWKFDYAKWLSLGQRINIKGNTLKGDEIPSPATMPEPDLVPDPPTGEDVPLRAEEGQEPPEQVASPAPAIQERREAMAVLLAAGVDRAGAWKALRTLPGQALVTRVSAIVQAVASLPSKPYRPAGLIVAAIKDPKIAQRLLAQSNGPTRATGGAPGVSQSNRPPSMPIVPRAPGMSDDAYLEAMLRRLA